LNTTELEVRTGSNHLVDITDEVQQFCRGQGDGLVHVFAPHATAGLALMEMGAGSEPDVEEMLTRVLPRDDRYTHRHGSPGHGADHVLPVLVSPSVVLPVLAGDLALGTWQHVVLVDLNDDNPRRTVRLSFIGA
jgi:secondary thiamine-phosphate synthase enzyme